MTASFYLRNLPILGNLIQAPIYRFTDSPLRQLFRSFGSAISYSEWIDADKIVELWNQRTIKTWLRVKYVQAERPIGLQMYGSEIKILVEAALILQDLSPDFIDINLGCPNDSVCKRGAGAAMLLEPRKIGQLFLKLSNTLSIPVTAKMRIGWDESTKNHQEVARVLEENGASLIAVHGRTKEEKHEGNSDWNAIAEIKNIVKIPVLGNGDVRNSDDIRSIKKTTSCDGVMIGRGAIGNPWIFSGRDRSQISPQERLMVIMKHLDYQIEHYGNAAAFELFQKHLYSYFPDMPNKRFMISLLSCQTRDTLEEALARWASDLDQKQ